MLHLVREISIFLVLLLGVSCFTSEEEKERCIEWLKTHLGSILLTVFFFWGSYKIGNDFLPPMKRIMDINSDISILIFFMSLILVRIVYVKERRKRKEIKKKLHKK